MSAPLSCMLRNAPLVVLDETNGIALKFIENTKRLSQLLEYPKTTQDAGVGAR